MTWGGVAKPPVMPRGVEVGPHPWDCLRGILLLSTIEKRQDPMLQLWCMPLCPSQAIPGVGAHPHTPGHHGWLRHPTPSHHQGLEHPTPSHHRSYKNRCVSRLHPVLQLSLHFFFTDEKTFCEQTGNIFIKTSFRNHKLCDEKHGIDLRTDSRFDSKSTYV